MQNIDLLSLREQFNRGNILLCFNGPISRSLIEEIGIALKGYLQNDKDQSSVALDVFGVYIELTQNIRHYAVKKGYNDVESSATVVVAKDDDNRYIVLAGNLLERDDGLALCDRITDLMRMDKTELKSAYKKQLREPRSNDLTRGAGLGLLDVARKISKPLITNLVDAENGRAFFSLLAVI